MAHKDLAVFEAPELVANAASALAARKRLAAEGVEYPDELFVRWLLPERLLFEPFSHWRSRLPGVVKKPESYVLQDVLAVVGEELAGIELVEEAFPGPVVRPVEIISSGRARSEKEVLYAAAALLRLFGLPARLYADWPVLEYFDGDSWRIFEPELENLPEIPRDFRAAAELRLAFTENGDRIGEEKSRYFRDFTISSYEKGVFEVLKAPFGEYLEQDKAWIFRLPPGEYAVVAGERSDGLVRVGVEILELPAGGRRSRTMALDL
jgi:hypothetical protein